ncbi:MAG: hypothetical protein C4539_04970 [Ignavibacteriales bacterium]|nr:MAG: hypothetical protein C4539_04970 [Ignavibacteriales bacterium]
MKISYRILSLVFVFAVLIAGCKKDDSNPTGTDTTGGTYSITLNGDGFSNKQVTINSAAGGYSTTNDVTGITLSCSDNIMVTLVSPGKQTGTFNFSVDETSSDIITGLLLVINAGTTSTKTYGVKSGSGTITISSYGSVGGQIKGSFTGKIYDVTSPTTEVTISGSFSATRVPDSE